MIFDHVAAVLIESEVVRGGGASVLWFLRYTVGRAALPLFMLVSGRLLAIHARSLRSVGRVFLVALGCSWVIWRTGLPLALPEILTLWCMVVVLGPAARRWPVWVAALGFVQSYAWRIVWPTYQPGALLVLLCLGILSGDRLGVMSAARSMWGRRWSRVPGFVVAIGRAPLRWYGGHVLVLAGVWSLL